MPISKEAIDRILRGKRQAKPYKLADAGGLYIYVTATALLWRYGYRRKSDGKQKTMSFGPYGTTPPGLDIDSARIEHLKARQIVKAGGDPAADRPGSRQRARKATGDDHRFGALTDSWLAARKVGNAPKTYARDERSAAYLKDGYRGADGFGDVDVEMVETAHLSNLAEKFNKPTRIRVISAARGIMAIAKRKGWIKHSPFSDVNFNDGLPKHREAKRPAITDEKRFGELLRKIEVYDGRSHNLTWYGLKLLALTFVRPGTMAKAEWDHFDLKRAQWVIPFEALKMASERSEAGKSEDDCTVPLSRQAVELLRELHKITGKDRYLFSGCADAEVMSENTLNFALHSMGYKGVHCAHGFRSSASTILNRQRTAEGRRRFEVALVEIQQDRLDASTRAIYDRDDLMPERIELMQFWADMVDTLRDDKMMKRLRIVA